LPELALAKELRLDGKYHPTPATKQAPAALLGRPGDGRRADPDDHAGRLITSYYLSAVPSDFGRGFRLEELGIDGGDVYHVHLGTDGTKSCECLGHLKGGATRVKNGRVVPGTVCKHIATILDLVADDILAGPTKPMRPAA
jgi:hypothetical protein